MSNRRRKAMRPYFHRECLQQESNKQLGFGREDEFRPIRYRQGRSCDRTGRHVMSDFSSARVTKV